MTSLLVTVLLAVGLGAPTVPVPGPDPPAERPPGAARAVWPLAPEPAVVHGFDPPVTAWSAGHRGVDLGGTPGQPVRAALAGVITFAGPVAGRGVVVVDHGGRRTTYEPVSPVVHRGDQVATGGRIGLLQAVPGHCPPRSCLHWGLVVDEEYQDPLSLLGLGPVRLLTPGGVPGGTPSGAGRW